MKLIQTALLVAGLAVAVTAHAQNVARVNGVAIPQAHLDLLVKNLVAHAFGLKAGATDDISKQLVTSVAARVTGWETASSPGSCRTAARPRRPGRT